jgi:hypothetical protein
MFRWGIKEEMTVLHFRSAGGEEKAKRGGAWRGGVN